MYGTYVYTIVEPKTANRVRLNEILSKTPQRKPMLRTGQIIVFKAQHRRIYITNFRILTPHLLS